MMDSSGTKPLLCDHESMTFGTQPVLLGHPAGLIKYLPVAEKVFSGMTHHRYITY
jgi:hypothetical protein